jgi:cold shock protein
MLGTIVKVMAGGYGFIQPDDGSGNTFFHCSSLDALEFSDQLLELRVQFESMNTERGPKATFVRAAK